MSASRTCTRLKRLMKSQRVASQTSHVGKTRGATRLQKASEYIGRMNGEWDENDVQYCRSKSTIMTTNILGLWT